MTATWVERLPVSHQVITTYTIRSGGVTVGALNKVATGSATVTMDTVATTLRTLAVTVADLDGTIAASGLLDPYGNEIAVASGIDDGNGGALLEPVGVFGITELTTVDSVSSSGGYIGPLLTVAASDRSFALAANLLVDTIVAAPGTPVSVAIADLAAAAAPSLRGSDIRIEDCPYLLPGQVLAVGTDPWATMKTWAASAGWIIYFDELGRLTFTPPPDPGLPIAVYAPGPGYTMTGLSSLISTSPAYNGAIVIGSYPGNIAVRGVAWDDDPASPTYYLGGYGRRPAPPVTLSTVLSQAQADAAAAALLPTILGASRPVTVTAIPDPRRRPYDVAYLSDGRDRIGGLYRLTASTLTLDHTAAMTMIFAPTGQKAGPLPSPSSFSADTTLDASGQSVITMAGTGVATIVVPASGTGQTTFAGSATATVKIVGGAMVMSGTGIATVVEAVSGQGTMTLSGSQGTAPLMTGTFVQESPVISGWSGARWDTELTDMAAAGIKTLILQWALDEDDQQTLYASGSPPPNMPGTQTPYQVGPDYVDSMLYWAGQHGDQVWIGLANYGAWQSHAGDTAWLNQQLALSEQVADQIFAAYGTNPAFAGWYIPFEVDAVLLDTPADIAPMKSFFTALAAYLHTHDGNKPVMCSPTYSYTGTPLTAAQFAPALVNVLGACDVINMQDGGANQSPATIASYFAAVKAALAGTATQLWSNPDMFSDSTGGPMPPAQLQADLKAAAPYVARLTGFSFPTQMGPHDIADPSFYNAYVSYYQTSPQ